MKKWFLKDILVLVIILVGIASIGSAEIYGDFEYMMYSGEVTITGYTGSDDTATIPASIDGYPVTSIGEMAFAWEQTLSHITLPESIVSIGSGAFAGTLSLVEISVDSNNLSYSDLSGVLCNKGETLLLQYPLGKTDSSYSIPASITSIGDGAFGGCNGLSSIEIGGSVTSIGMYAFDDCNGLTTVTVGSGVNVIGEEAFGSCDSLISITVNINNSLYCDVNGILFSKNKTLIILHPRGKTTTGYSIPHGVVSIGNHAFSACRNLTGITIPDSVTSIIQSAFSYCSGLTNIMIPDSVIDIQQHAFTDCTGLTSVTTGNGVTNIGDSAFASCDGLVNIDLPESLISIGDGVFESCANLTGIYFYGNAPNSEFFSYFESIATIYYHSGSSGWNSSFQGLPTRAFSIVSFYAGLHGEISSGDPIQRILDEEAATAPSIIPDEGWTFEEWDTNFSFVTSDEMVTAQYSTSSSIESDYEYTVSGNEVTITGYTGVGGNITIPNTINSVPVVHIRDAAFYLCDTLTSVIIPDSVTSIGDDAFYACWRLTSIIIPDSVISIGGHAFSQCNLTSVTIPSSVISIGGGGFSDGCRLTNILVDASNLFFESIDGVLFSEDQLRLLQYPAGITNAIYAIPSGVTNIGDSAFSYCHSLTSIIIPNSVTSIGDQALRNCDSMTNILVAASNLFFESIDGALFSEDQLSLLQYPVGITNAFYAIPSGVTNIGGSAFSGCYHLMDAMIPKSVTSVGSWAFSGCDSMTSMTIPDRVTSIEESAFAYCGNLTTIYCAGNAPTLGSAVFYSCDSATLYYLPDTTGWTNPWGGRPTVLLDGDIDSDGLPDAWEVNHFGNLDQEANGDPDNDGRTNSEEFADGTDPTEERMDSDGDGMSDADEVIAGTSPVDAQSLLEIEASQIGLYNRLSWFGVSGRYYRLEQTGRLGDPWVRKGSIMVGEDDTIIGIDFDAVFPSFYRVRVSESPDGL